MRHVLSCYSSHACHSSHVCWHANHGDPSNRYGDPSTRDESCIGVPDRMDLLKVWAMLCASTKPADAFFRACRTHQPSCVLARSGHARARRMQLQLQLRTCYCRSRLRRTFWHKFSYEKELLLLIFSYELRSNHAKTTLVKRDRFLHKTQQNDKVHFKPITPAPSAVYDPKYAATSKHGKTMG